MTTDLFVPGQRWLSNNEPELGLGLVMSASKGRITLLFPAGNNQTRQYAIHNAPLTRMSFEPGSEVRGREGETFLVEKVENKNGLLVYYGNGHVLEESALADSLNFTRPQDRLLNAQLDDKNLFNLRSKCLHHRFETLRGHQRGFIGPRIELIPHQLFTALQIRRRGIPRVVLADESGIGKTIEACLVLHRLMVTSRIEKALIIVPERLVSRWHFELTRRFHQEVTVLEPGVKKVEATTPVVLGDASHLAAAAKAAWDLLIVDDADKFNSPSLKKLCKATPGVILLTDLPPQTEREAHKRMRRLLDGEDGPAPIPEEALKFAEKLLAPTPEPWPEEEHAALNEFLGTPVDPAVFTQEQGDGRERVIAALLETLGIGRRLLRNTRATVEGLPERELFAQKLPWPEEAPEALKESLRSEFLLPDGEPNPDHTVLPEDPRLAWLENYIKENPRDKIVLICATRAKAERIAELLGPRASLHHDGLPMPARDAAVARFTEKDDDGVPVLVCSECGVEGRALPFAHHLVLFDLPPDPELISKRIGNLDRYGHMAKVRVHVPYVEKTPAEVFFEWFQSGLNLFEHSLEDVLACGREYGAKFRKLAMQPPETWEEELKTLVPAAHQHMEETKNAIADNPRRLTQLASFRALPANRLLESIRRLDSDLSLDFLMLRLFDHFGFEAEDVGERTYNVRPREKDRHPEAFPTIGPDGQLVTFERQKALARDDLWFLTWDHPLVMEHINLVLKSTDGNSCYAVWEDMRSQIILLEALFRVELEEMPKKLYPTRFFSPAGVRLIVNHDLEDVAAEYPMELVNKNVRNGRREWIRNNNQALRRLLPRMLARLHELAQQRAEALKQEALKALDDDLLPEIDRLKLLRKRGGPASDFEIDLLEKEYATLKEVLAKPVVRLDALRLVRRGPTGKGI